MKNTAVKLALLCLVAVMAVGCVSQRRADDLETLYRRSQEQVIELRAQLEECRSRVRALQNAPKVQDPELLSRLEQALAERDRLTEALAKAEESLRAAGQGNIALPEDLNQALVGLAQSNPELIEYDAQRGMLRFRSDLTFALGSAEVNDSARNSLSRLAEILRSASAASYETKIVGHTDTVPVSRPQTRAKHPNNWYLSVHRSIAVMEILEKAGVPPVRLSVVGQGQWRPVVTPVGNRGVEANRRVEIYLVPSTYQGPSGAGVADAPSAQRPAAQGAGRVEQGTAPKESPAMYK